MFFICYFAGYMLFRIIAVLRPLQAQSIVFFCDMSNILRLVIDSDLPTKCSGEDIFYKTPPVNVFRLLVHKKFKFFTVNYSLLEPKYNTIRYNTIFTTPVTSHYLQTFKLLSHSKSFCTLNSDLTIC